MTHSLIFHPWEVKWKALILQSQASQPSADPAHDLLHLERVVATAKALAAQEGANLDIVVPSAWFHDWVAVPKNSPQRSQASKLSSDSVQTLLLEQGYPKELIPEIRHAIEAHSFSAGVATRTLEAEIVQDADRLDALGAIGIARCFSTAGTLGSIFYSTIDPFCREREPDDKKFAVDHFYRKLFRLPDTFKTKSGKHEALRRVQFMHLFLSQMEKEIR